MAYEDQYHNHNQPNTISHNSSLIEFPQQGDQQLQAAIAQVLDLQYQLDISQAQLQYFRQRIEQKQTDIKKWHDKIDKKKSTIANLKDKIRVIDVKIKDVGNGWKGIQHERNILQLALSQHRNQRLDKQLSNNQLSQYYGELSERKAQLVKEIQDFVELENEQAELQAENQRLLNEINIFESNNAHTTDESQLKKQMLKKKLKKTLDRANQLQAQRQDIEQKYDDYRDKIAMAKQKQIIYNNKVKQLAGITANVNRIKETIKKKKLELSVKEKNYNELVLEEDRKRRQRQIKVEHRDVQSRRISVEQVNNSPEHIPKDSHPKRVNEGNSKKSEKKNKQEEKQNFFTSDERKDIETLISRFLKIKSVKK